MNFQDDIDNDYLTMAELTNEIGSIVQNSITQRRDELNPDEVKHIIKMTSNVIKKLNKQAVQLTV